MSFGFYFRMPEVGIDHSVGLLQPCQYWNNTNYGWPFHDMRGVIIQCYINLAHFAIICDMFKYSVKSQHGRQTQNYGNKKNHSNQNQFLDVSASQ